ncbi:Arginine--tRNA ligase [Gammaproteobacteria bacterium]
MKHFLENLLTVALAQLRIEGWLPPPGDDTHTVVVERTRDRVHGDFASNLALTLAKQAKRKPRELADALRARLPSDPRLDRVEVAGPGFLNFFLTSRAYQDVVAHILEEGKNFGRLNLGAGRLAQVEFVSANPTGPLHVGHGRGAAYGAAVADLLAAVGFRVQREYYVNDAGRQMDILAISVWLRYLELCGETLRFPSNGYQGNYVWDIAATLHRTHGEDLRIAAEVVFTGVPEDAANAEERAAGIGPNGDMETHVDGLISRAKHLLGDKIYRMLFDLGLNTILNDIRDDLAHFGVYYDKWYSERSLMESGKVEEVINRLKDAGYLYLKDGAWWFRSSDFGDEKDRVVVRENGQITYFASDIAYHIDKMARGFEWIVDIWGADHHGYVPRVKAALAALGNDAEKLHVLLVQFAILYKNGEKMRMSTRSGEFVTLRELRKEVGKDAARFFYVLRSSEQHMDFDLDLAKSQSNDNPVYYCQYAHARVRSVFRTLTEKRLSWERAAAVAHLPRLTENHEQALMTTLSRYSEMLAGAALNHAPHLLANYLRELATDFHTYYNAHLFLVEDAELRAARLALIEATRQVLSNGLELLGVSAPDTM